MFNDFCFKPSGYLNKIKTPVAIIVCGMVAFMILNGCAPRTTITRISLLSPSETSFQLLDDQYLALLNDRLTIKSNPTYPQDKVEFTIVNKTTMGLTIELSGQGGSYTFVTDPKRDQTWLINTGTYHVEISVPGFPTTATDELFITPASKYKWELWKTKH